MSECMTQEDAMNMNNEQAIQILEPFQKMMLDQNGCPISAAYFALGKAIEALRHPENSLRMDKYSYQGKLEKAYDDGYEQGYAQAKFDYEQRWIPCSERLPEVCGRYLVTRGLNACGSLWNRVYITNYSDLMGLKSEKIWWHGSVGKSDFERLDDVLAWMPLPEPYEERRTE